MIISEHWKVHKHMLAHKNIWRMQDFLFYSFSIYFCWFGHQLMRIEPEHLFPLLNVQLFAYLFLNFCSMKGKSTYLGAAPIVECLEKYQPDVIITSRVADAALFLGPMVWTIILSCRILCFWDFCNILPCFFPLSEIRLAFSCQACGVISCLLYCFFKNFITWLTLA